MWPFAGLFVAGQEPAEHRATAENKPAGMIDGLCN
jgi:hypothetical protein